MSVCACACACPPQHYVTITRHPPPQEDARRRTLQEEAEQRRRSWEEQEREERRMRDAREAEEERKRMIEAAAKKIRDEVWCRVQCGVVWCEVTDYNPTRRRAHPHAHPPTPGSNQRTYA